MIPLQARPSFPRGRWRHGTTHVHKARKAAWLVAWPTPSPPRTYPARVLTSARTAGPILSSPTFSFLQISHSDFYSEYQMTNRFIVPKFPLVTCSGKVVAYVSNSKNTFRSLADWQPSQKKKGVVSVEKVNDLKASDSWGGATITSSSSIPCNFTPRCAVTFINMAAGSPRTRTS